MQKISLCLIGFGNVGQAFARLILKKQAGLEKEPQIQLLITAIATNRHGIAVNPGGIDLEQSLQLIEAGKSIESLNTGSAITDSIAVIKNCHADVLLENSPVNYFSGQPAIDHITAALEAGMHAITANKGPVLHAYRKLMATAVKHGKKFLFESTVMDGAPIFSLFRSALPANRLLDFEGVLNSCTNLLLDRMASGETLEQAVEFAQSIGITETDPSGDIDGWDAAIKVAILVNVLMDYPLKLEHIARCGIRDISKKDIDAAKKNGLRWKLLCRAERLGDKVLASVAPEKVSAESPLFSVQGTSSFIKFRTESLTGLGILESNPGPETTAYGLLADLLSIVEKS